jgi:hypothetical protein
MIAMANGLIIDTVSYFKRNRNQRNSVELMKHLLNRSEEEEELMKRSSAPLLHATV